MLVIKIAFVIDGAFSRIHQMCARVRSLAGGGIRCFYVTNLLKVFKTLSEVVNKHSKILCKGSNTFIVMYIIICIINYILHFGRGELDYINKCLLELHLGKNKVIQDN